MAQNYSNKRPHLQFTTTKHMQGVEEVHAECLVYYLNGPAYEQVIA